ncbi:MAG: hypothetical protein P1S60_14520 [Anaerolineae bacterium]|nr:hypothetical protein [Anaerolineae bacterium]
MTSLSPFPTLYYDRLGFTGTQIRLLRGLLYESVGAAETFRAGGVIAPVGLAIFLFSTRSRQQHTAAMKA